MRYRTCSCGALRPTHIGIESTLCGWVDSRRDHGSVIFVDLRDQEGKTQVVFRPEGSDAAVTELAHSLRSEDIIQVMGKVTARLPGTENRKLVTGEIEVVASSLKVFSRADVSHSCLVIRKLPMKTLDSPIAISTSDGPSCYVTSACVIVSSRVHACTWMHWDS